jgi:hypothetical protein
MDRALLGLVIGILCELGLLQAAVFAKLIRGGRVVSVAIDNHSLCFPIEALVGRMLRRTPRWVNWPHIVGGGVRGHDLHCSVIVQHLPLSDRNECSWAIDMRHFL